MKILLLSAYDAMSHRYWREALVDRFPEHDWHVLTLPARYFSWRQRGNSLSWAFNERNRLDQAYDLLIATSMTDLSGLKGLVPALADTPSIVYFHENQFAYPRSSQAHSSVEPQILNLYTALAADCVVFNTRYNRDTFLHGCAQLLDKLPDHVPAGLVERLNERTCVLPVPLPESCFQSVETDDRPLHIVWNHRWEYDKNPDLLLQALRVLKQDEQTPFRLSLVGQQFRKIPESLVVLQEEFRQELAHSGYLESTAYRQVLRQADVVLSTANHDFQGIAVLEGVAAGCVPVVPDRLAYRELFDEGFRYNDSRSGKEGSEAQQLATHLAERAKQKQQGALPDAPDVRWLSWAQQAPAYGRLFESVLTYKKR